MNKYHYTIVLAAIILFSMSCTIFCGTSRVKEQLQPGSRYIIDRPIYLIAWYHDLGNKQISRGTAYAYLSAEKNAKRVWIPFQCEVPAGTIMTIIGPAKKAWRLYYFVDKYVVKLEPDISRGLDVTLELDRGLEGTMDGLNPELFSRACENRKNRGQPPIK